MRELTGMLLHAKQTGNLSEYKELWSFRRVNWKGKPEEILSDCKPKDGEQIDGASDRAEIDRPESPCTDRSPSPPPKPGKWKEVKYQYYRVSFATRDLPILLVSYFHPSATSKRICCYGGSEHGERCFLSSFG